MWDRGRKAGCRQMDFWWGRKQLAHKKRQRKGAYEVYELFFLPSLLCFLSLSLWPSCLSFIFILGSLQLDQNTKRRHTNKAKDGILSFLLFSEYFRGQCRDTHSAERLNLFVDHQEKQKQENNNLKAIQQAARASLQSCKWFCETLFKHSCALS